MTNSLAIAIGVAGGLLAGLVLILEAGFWMGRRAALRKEAPSGGQVGAIQAAVLGLLGLLLGFSFAGAASRFLERQDLIVQEANAIGTAYLRADMLDEPYAGRVRDVLARYVRHRIEVSKSLGGGYQAETAAEISEFHARLWEAARDGVRANASTMLTVLNPVNDVIDLHSTRVFASRKHLPLQVMGLLIICSLLSMAVIGFGNGLSGQRALPMTLALALLIAAALWITIDLDHPRAGLIQLSDAPLEQLKLSFRPTSQNVH